MVGAFHHPPPIRVLPIPLPTIHAVGENRPFITNVSRGTFLTFLWGCGGGIIRRRYDEPANRRDKNPHGADSGPSKGAHRR